MDFSPLPKLNNLPDWMIDAGVTIAQGTIILGTVAAALFMAPIKIYATAMGIAINIVDPQPKDDPAHMV